MMFKPMEVFQNLEGSSIAPVRSCWKSVSPYFLLVIFVADKSPSHVDMASAKVITTVSNFLFPACLYQLISWVRGFRFVQTNKSIVLYSSDLLV